MIDRRHVESIETILELLSEASGPFEVHFIQRLRTVLEASESSREISLVRYLTLADWAWCERTADLYASTCSAMGLEPDAFPESLYAELEHQARRFSRAAKSVQSLLGARHELLSAGVGGVRGGLLAATATEQLDAWNAAIHAIRTLLPGLSPRAASMAMAKLLTEGPEFNMTAHRIPLTPGSGKRSGAEPRHPASGSDKPAPATTRRRKPKRPGG